MVPNGKNPVFLRWGWNHQSVSSNVRVDIVLHLMECHDIPQCRPNSCGKPQKHMYNLNWLVVWNIFYFSIYLGIILPFDFHIFQRGRSNHQPVKLVAILKSRPAARKARPKCSAVKVSWRRSCPVVWREPGGATIRVYQPHDRWYVFWGPLDGFVMYPLFSTI